MANKNEIPNGTGWRERAEEIMPGILRAHEKWLAESTVETVETDRWTTPDGYEIVVYQHRRDYPAYLRFPGINPGQTEEMRGWPCPKCGSTDTSCWGVSNAPDTFSYECRNCDATGRWVLECARSPSPIHLDDECACAPNCGCVQDPLDPTYLGPMHRVTPTAETTMTVPMTHQPGCTAADRTG